jgi:hypothetical protein
VEVVLLLRMLKGDEALHLPVLHKQEDVLAWAFQGLPGAGHKVLPGFHPVVVDVVARPGGVQGQLVGKADIAVKFRFL